MCLTWSPSCPHTTQSFHPKKVVAPAWRRQHPSACLAFLGRHKLRFTVSSAAPLPSLPPGHSWKETQEKGGRHTVSWAQGQMTFPIQHLYKSYLMKLRGKKN